MRDAADVAIAGAGEIVKLPPSQRKLAVDTSIEVRAIPGLMPRKAATEMLWPGNTIKIENLQHLRLCLNNRMDDVRHMERTR